MAMKWVPKVMTSIALSGAVSGVSADAKEDGKQIYQLNCAACHGANGEGAGNGTFPPLAKSEWLAGDAERSIQILLHGLDGPVEVGGKVYNLAMPPQGVLNDAQVAAVLTYVRSHFGNKESAVTTQQVVAARKKSEGRSEPWNADELLKIYPLPAPETALKNLIMHEYHGRWEALPDFSQLEPDAVEEESYGLFSFRNIDKKKQFGVVWQGQIHAPDAAEYSFEMIADDGARLSVAGQQVVEAEVSESKNGWRMGKVKLEKGPNPIRLEYFQLDGGMDLQLRWSGPGISGKQLLTDKPKKGKRKPAGAPVIDLSPKGDEAVMYNNFIAGTTPRAVAVGYPGGMNLAFSTEHCAPEVFWRGKFISGGLHWTGRGKGAAQPLSKEVVALTKQPAYHCGSSKEVKEKSEVRYLGYTLDSKRFPTFHYRVGDAEVYEKWTAAANGMQRHIKIESKGRGFFTALVAQNVVK